jgi:hypothetical protein
MTTLSETFTRVRHANMIAPIETFVRVNHSIEQ